MEEKWVVIGIDLGERGAQISYCLNGEREVKTYSLSREEDQFLIPLEAYQNPENKAKSFGFEAQAAAEKGKGETEKDLLKGAMESEDGVRLLGLYFSYLLHLPKEILGTEVRALVFSLREVDQRVCQVLERAVESAGIQIPVIRYVSYGESFFFYALSQKIELWRYGVVLFEYDDSRFEVRRLTVDQHLEPAFVTVEEKSYPIMLPFTGQDKEKLDRSFLSIAEGVTGTGALSGVYLTGSAFEERWENGTLKFLCSRARVFQGQNLYSKGACYAATDVVSWSRLSGKFVFLDKNSLRQNISIRAISKGKEELLSVMDAGLSWYNASAEKEVLLGQDKEIVVVLNGMMDENERNVVLRLSRFPDRPDRASRVLLRFYFEERDILVVEIQDLGFGDLFPSSGMVQTERIRLQEG
ncbi:MAG: hypothetical protein K5989_02100 [Lachnospiraceae bacterium]|nr:hypothetical protein [Lachnospiraceae bacterium]